MSTTIKHWVPVPTPWERATPKTLADVPNDTQVICCDLMGRACVMTRIGEQAFYTDGSYAGGASQMRIYHLLDPLPEATLDELPDGRCFQVPNVQNIFWKHGGKSWGFEPSTGEYWTVEEISLRGSCPSVLPLVMELREVTL